jgi:hypothetical protein
MFDISLKNPSPSSNQIKVLLIHILTREKNASIKIELYQNTPSVNYAGRKPKNTVAAIAILFSHFHLEVCQGQHQI